MVQLSDIQAAQTALAPYIRRTPLVKAAPVRQPICDAGFLALKLENMQITGSFKARGAMNTLLSLPKEHVARGVVTASGGNHGLGVAYAGWLAKVPATIYLPLNAPASKAEALARWGAQVIVGGATWDDANRAALARAEEDGLAYIHAFADPAVIAGQGTIGLEILEDAPEIDTLLVAIGGGGLMSGVSLAVKAMNPAIRVIGVEPVGAPTLYESVRAGHVVELAEVHTAANTLAPRQSAEINLEIIQKNVDEIALVSDDEMREAAQWLWEEMGVAAELSGAAALAALQSGKIRVTADQRVCAIVCGAGTAGLPL